MTDFLERTLEDIIYDNRYIISDNGFDQLLEVTVRQFRLPSGKIIDLMSWDIKGDVLFVKIIELKKGPIDSSAFFQGMEYYNEFLSYTLGCFAKINAELILVGNSLTADMKNLISLNAPVALYLYFYDYNGIKFTRAANNFNTHYLPMFNEIYASNNKGEHEIHLCNYLRECIYEFEQEANEFLTSHRKEKVS